MGFNSAFKGLMCVHCTNSTEIGRVI